MICDIWKVTRDTDQEIQSPPYTGFLHSDMFRAIRGQNQRPDQNIKNHFCSVTKSPDIQKHILIVFAHFFTLSSIKFYLDQD